MFEITIPGKEIIRIEKIVFDVNGTIATDGSVEESIKRKLIDLSKKVNVYLLTADTYGTIEEEMRGSGIEIRKISPSKEGEQKEDFVKELGEHVTLAIGNGSNDGLMLKRAIIGICVVGKEGAASTAIAHSDLVIYGNDMIFDLLENPKRLIATLRK